MATTLAQMGLLQHPLIRTYLLTIEMACLNLHLIQMQLLLRDELKNNPSGIYAFICIPTKKVYIGSSLNLRKRFSQHISGVRTNILLKRAITKYGLDNFCFVIMEYCPPERLLEREQVYLDFVSTEFKFNFLTVAGSTLGYKHTTDAKLAMSGENHPLFGKQRSAETRALISLSSTGRVLSEETRSQISESLKAKDLSGENNPFFGHRHSEETREAMSIALSGSNHYMFGKVANNARSTYLYGLDNKLIRVFSSKTELAQHLSVSRGTVNKYMNSGIAFNNLYFLRDSPIDV
ncbi:hypothetical protein BC938DRAFT_480575 [Jimgerdemannia flammicorona]|uniref:GIY-YIG domain-containing protein n=1 Tax=Jimgerdemannia flammicorona TaxID=994334 RepID=A0A433QX85_9FUNG|nr:hypothetical protein BC938DRAFT_480575 [Jimgerdemannia flammicorona]